MSWKTRRTDKSETYYFVVCQHDPRGENVIGDISNHILKGIHPVVWACNPPEEYKKFFVTKILFWEEIPEAVATEAGVMKMFTLAD